MDEKPIEQMGLNEIHETARRLMPAEAWEYVMGAADSGATMERNVAAFKNFLFQQRIFHQVTDPDISVTVFGRTVPTPAWVAPIGSFYRINETAERDVADGTSSANTILFVSYATNRMCASGLRARVLRWSTLGICSRAEKRFQSL